MLGTHKLPFQRARVPVAVIAACCSVSALSPANATAVGASMESTARPAVGAVARSSLRTVDLIRNPDFRFGGQGWTLSGAASGAPNISGSGRKGSPAALIDAARPGAVVLRNTRTNSAVSAKAGDSLVVSALIRAASGRATGSLSIEGRAGASTSGRAVASFNLTDAAWHRVTTRVTVSRFTSGARALLAIEDPHLRGRVLVDQVHLYNPAVAKLRYAGFDGLRTGPIAPTSFMRTLGGTVSNPQSYDDTSVVKSHNRGRVLRTRLQAGTIASSPAGNNGIVILAPLPRAVDQACLSYQIRFDGRFDWSLGGKLPGLLGVAPGTDPGLVSGGRDPGDLGWSGRQMWVGPDAYSWAGPHNMAVSYMYGPAQRERYGDVLPWGRGYRQGRWHTVMACYTMNTVGRADGVLRAWFDGRVVLSRTEYTYRTRSDVHVTHLAWSIFRGGNTMDWAGSRDGNIDIDSVLITTR